MGAKAKRPAAVDLIGKDELLTSSELKKRLVDRGYTEANARKIISRILAEDEKVWRSEAIQLPSGGRLFCRRKTFGTARFYEQLARILAANRPGLARCMATLAKARVLTKVQICKLIACPVKAQENAAYPCLDAEVAALRELGIKVVQEGTAFEYFAGARIRINDHSNELAAQAISCLRVEAILVQILIERFRRQNLISWSGAQLPTRDEPAVVFNNQYFSATSFCHLGPVRRLKATDSGVKSIASPVLFDVLAGRCTADEVRSFLARAERATCRGEKRQPWLGVIAAREFDPDAWKQARSEGLMTLSFRQTFGDEALDAMTEVEQLLTAFQNDADPEAGKEKLLSFAQCLEHLRTNPVVVDLRSVGFEILAGMALRSAGYEKVGLNQDVPWRSTTRDVDVHGVIRGDRLKIIECKANRATKSLASEDVVKFFTETLPAYVSWWKSQNGNRAPRGRPPTSSRFLVG